MKLSYIDWYLVELRRDIHGKIPIDRESSLIEETRTHLSSIVEDLMSDGISQETAEKVAIERFGDPSRIARHYLTMNQTATSKSQRIAEATIFALITLGIFLIMSDFSTIRADRLAYALGVPAVFFYCFSRLTGRIPRAKLFLAPVICVSILALPAAGLISFYSASSGKLSVHLQRDLNASLAEAIGRDTEATKIEDYFGSVWKQLLKDPKVANGISAGSMVDVPGYRAMGTTGVYIQMDMKNGEKTRYADGTEKVVLANSDVHLEVLRPRSPATWRGPMTRAEFEKKLRREIATSAWQRKYRAQAVGILRGAVDRPYPERYCLFVVPFLVIYGLGALPIGLLFSFFGQSVYRFFQFRKRMRLV
ncbi:MAG: permease prefix domain 1-containing protein [Armatimonadota bacterium]